MKTKAAIIERKGGSLRIEEIDIADPGPGQVRVKVQACGICRSDLHAIDGGESVRYPAVLGHEAAGVIEALGPGTAAAAVGDRVILSWTPACGGCAPCRRGDVQLCRGLRMSADPGGPLTWDGRELDRFMALGAFCEHVVVPEKMAVPIRGEIPPAHACLIGCGVMTGFGAATKTANVRWGETVAVIGCGGVGLSAVQGSRIAGAGRVFAIDPIPERRDVALRVGATDALDSSDALATVLQATGGGVDAAIECVGSVQAMVAAFNVIRPGGRAVVVGLAAASDVLSIPAMMLLTEKSIKGSIYGSANPALDFPKLVDLYEQARLDLEPLAGSMTSLDRINESIAEMREGKLTRAVVTFP